MNIANLVSTDNVRPDYSQGGNEPYRPAHSYSTRHGTTAQGAANTSQSATAHPRPPLSRVSLGLTPAPTPIVNRSPEKTVPKTVHFHLMLSNNSQQRLPLRVSVKAHDSAESIISTVKSFWGLYEGQGLGFEDEHGNTLIAQYENLEQNANIFVRVYAEILEPTPTLQHHPYGASAHSTPRLGEPFQMMPPQQLSRPVSRAARRRDTTSPSGHAHRSGSSRAQQRIKGTDDDNSDSDAGSVSVSSSRRARGELASAEISLDNIVEGGRRKRAKFESSELPLFAPPQQPMAYSISSMSPQRRFQNGHLQSPMPYNNHKTFSYSQQPMIFSPHGYGHSGIVTPHTGSIASGQFSGPGNGTSRQLRDSGHSIPPRLSGGSTSGVLPTPDPTVGSVISDEDVALQLMRLGDASNLSRGRTSTSTIDDTLSGKAEAASSGGASDHSSAGVDERPTPSLPNAKPRNTHANGPPRKKLKGTIGVEQHYSSDMTSAEDYEDFRDGTFKGGRDGLDRGGATSGSVKIKSRPLKQKSRTNSISSKGRPNQAKVKSKSSNSKVPQSLYSAATDSRQSSAISTTAPQQLDVDEDDLSTKPRCQRCRKSKKGCDRQRPCQRCKDAGIGVDGCVSEDEGNGRKGRFGRHMGVPLNQSSTDSISAYGGSVVASTDGYADEAGFVESDASKKRKR